jgi:hypothetical protein
MEIRSYRRVFALERRIYRIDRLRLNPSWLPVRGVVYFLTLLAITAMFARLPLPRVAIGMLPWYLRYLALPGVAAAVLTMISVDGRPFHLAAHALLRHPTGPRLSIATAGTAGPGGGTGPPRADGGHVLFRPRRWWHPEPILIIPDGSDARMRRLRYTGPGAVLVGVEHERAGRASERGAAGYGRAGRRPVLIIRELPGGRTLGRGTVIALACGARLLVRPDRSGMLLGKQTRHAASRTNETPGTRW